MELVKEYDYFEGFWCSVKCYHKAIAIQNSINTI